MRLNSETTEVILEAAAEVFGEDAEVWLFGSRVDDRRRGGDIDLYIEAPPSCLRDRAALEARFWARLQRSLGERKVDVVTHARGAPLRPIDQQARATGVRL